jgi:hypothetical protein
MPRRWFRQVMDKGLVIAASGPASSPGEGYIAALLRDATKIFGEDGKRYRRRGTGETEVPALPSVVAATEHMDPGRSPGSQPPYGSGAKYPLLSPPPTISLARGNRRKRYGSAALAAELRTQGECDGTCTRDLQVTKEPLPTPPPHRLAADGKLLACLAGGEWSGRISLHGRDRGSDEVTASRRHRRRKQIEGEQVESGLLPDALPIELPLAGVGLEPTSSGPERSNRALHHLHPAAGAARRAL